MDSKRNRGPVGAGDYTATDSDCLRSIAFKHGLLAETLWAHPDNRELKERRWDPGELLKGDRIAIPERRPHYEVASTEQCHRYRRLGLPEVLRLVIEHDDQPVANTPYRMTIDGVQFEGETNASGLIRQGIQANASKGVIEIDGLTYELSFGTIAPADEDIGVQIRLANLGFYDGGIDGIVGPLTRGAIAVFQQRLGLKSTGDLDSDTSKELLHRHDEEHDALPEDDAADCSLTTG